MDKDWNFIDPDTGEKLYFQKYSIGFVNGDKIFKVDGKQLVNKDGKPLLDRERNEGFCTNFGKIASMNVHEKQAYMKKRSKEHSKKHIPNHKDNGFNGY